MKTHVLKGTKSEIADALARMDGVIREVIVFVEEPADSILPPIETEEDFLAEMGPHMVSVDGVDDSREAIYTRMEGE